VPHLSNGEFVISELGIDPALNDVYKDMLVFVPGNKSEVRVRRCGLLSSHPSLPLRGLSPRTQVTVCLLRTLASPPKHLSACKHCKGCCPGLAPRYPARPTKATSVKTIPYDHTPPTSSHSFELPSLLRPLSLRLMCLGCSLPQRMCCPTSVPRPPRCRLARRSVLGPAPPCAPSVGVRPCPRSGKRCRRWWMWHTLLGSRTRSLWRPP
jgi:hypothetical protein